MPTMLVTCPDTAHLEEIEYEDDPLGMLIRRCSRFGPPCALSCARICAARLDRKRVTESPTETDVRVILFVRSCFRDS